jgi:hypothetical protein
MFYITAETCRRFTFAEVLIMAAMNVKTTRPASRSRIQARTELAQRG